MLDPSESDRYIVPKRRYLTSLCCVYIPEEWRSDLHGGGSLKRIFPSLSLLGQHSVFPQFEPLHLACGQLGLTLSEEFSLAIGQTSNVSCVKPGCFIHFFFHSPILRDWYLLFWFRTRGQTSLSPRTSLVWLCFNISFTYFLLFLLLYRPQAV
jgi:hypothetical protein